MKNSTKALAVLSAFFLVACGANGNKCDQTGVDCEYVAQQIANKLFGSSTLDKDYYYDSGEEMYYIPVSWGETTTEKAIGEATAYLLDGVTCDETAAYDSQNDYYFAYYTYCDVLIDLYAYADSTNGTVVEFDIYLDSNNGGEEDSTSEPAGETTTGTYGNAECISIIETIAKNLFDTSVYGEDYYYDEDDDCYYAIAAWGEDATISSAISEAILVLPDDAKCDVATTYDSTYNCYYAYYSCGGSLIDIYSYDDEDYGACVEFDVYLDDGSNDDIGGGDSGDEPSGDTSTATYSDPNVIAVTKSIATSLLGSATLGETYDYDSENDLYYVYATIDTVSSASAAMTEAITHLPSGCTCDQKSTYDSEGYYYAYYSKDDVLIDIYAMDDDEGYYIEFDIYLNEEDDDTTGGSTGGTTGGTTTGGTGTGTTSSDGYTIATLSFAGMSTEENGNVAFSSSKVGSITFTVDQGKGSNPPLVYTYGDALRLYASNTLTVTADAGTTIEKIVINCTSIGENKVQDATNFTVTGGTYSATSTAGTVVSITGSTVVLKQSATSGNVRVSSVEVYYK